MTVQKPQTAKVHCFKEVLHRSGGSVLFTHSSILDDVKNCGLVCLVRTMYVEKETSLFLVSSGLSSCMRLLKSNPVHCIVFFAMSSISLVLRGPTWGKQIQKPDSRLSGHLLNFP